MLEILKTKYTVKDFGVSSTFLGRTIIHDQNYHNHVSQLNLISKALQLHAYNHDPRRKHLYPNHRPLMGK